MNPLTGTEGVLFLFIARRLKPRLWMILPPIAIQPFENISGDYVSHNRNHDVYQYT